MKKVFWIVIIIIVLALIGNSRNSTTTSSYSSARICQATGCTNKAKYSITGLSGKKEYYCATHYNQMKKWVNDMFGD